MLFPRSFLLRRIYKQHFFWLTLLRRNFNAVFSLINTFNFPNFSPKLLILIFSLFFKLVHLKRIVVNFWRRFFFCSPKRLIESVAAEIQSSCVVVRRNFHRTRTHTNTNADTSYVSGHLKRFWHLRSIAFAFTFHRSFDSWILVSVEMSAHQNKFKTKNERRWVRRPCFWWTASTPSKNRNNFLHSRNYRSAWICTVNTILCIIGDATHERWKVLTSKQHGQFRKNWNTIRWNMRAYSVARNLRLVD